MRHALIAAVTLLSACTPRPASAVEVPGHWRGHAVVLLDEGGRPLPAFEHRGRTWVLGTLGQRYAIRFHNGSGRRVEVVASVDGRDVVDGRPASFERRGYVVEPWGEVTIDGYRLSEGAVAAFRFSSVPRSYAARRGDARDVGVIGLAVFPERRVPESRGEKAGDAAPSPLESRGEKAGVRGEADRTASRPGLGTEFGEERGSPVVPVHFERASSRPEAVLTLRYDDRAGLLAQGVDVDGARRARREEARRREAATPFRAEYCEPPAGWDVR